MNKIFSFALCAALLSCNIIFSQVGVGTTEPKRSLDINGNIRVQKTSDYSTQSNPQDYNNFLLSSNGATNPDEKGNVDYITLEDLRSKLRLPVGFKGTGNNSYNSVNEGKLITFSDTGLQLRLIGDGTLLIPTFVIQARITTGGTTNVELTEFAGDLNVSGGAAGENKNLTINWTDLAWLYPATSQTGEIVMIFNVTAQTYKITLATKDQGVGVQHFALIAQQLMD